MFQCRCSINLAAGPHSKAEQAASSTGVNPWGPGGSSADLLALLLDHFNSRDTLSFYLSMTACMRGRRQAAMKESKLP